MRLSLACCLVSIVGAACGGGGGSAPQDAPKDVGFAKPTAGVHANTEVTDNNWEDLGPADLTCLNTPSADQPTTVAVTLTTTVLDFQSGNAVPLAAVTAFKDVAFTTTFDSETADSNGNVTIQIPVGVTRFGFQMTADQAMPTFLLNQYVDPDTAAQTLTRIQSVSDATGETLPALIGETRQPGTGVIAGALRDCQMHEMSNFVATVSSTPTTATPIAGAEAYYFAASVGLPVHHNQQESSSGDGIFMVIQLQPAPSAYVQMWGYPTDADVGGDMTLIAQLLVPVVADNVITGSYEPLRQ
jgi:hypothetical protein